MTRLLLQAIESWPGRLRPEGDRVPTPFSASHDDTLELLQREVGMLAGRDADAVVEIAARPDDLYRDGSGLKPSARPLAHPGVVVSFTTTGGKPLQFATDRHTGRPGHLPGWQSNLRAVALALEALRRVDRYGVGADEQQYVGWGQLPPGTPMPPAGGISMQDAARLLVRHADGLVDVADLLDSGGVDVVMVKRVFRDITRRLHPDQEGADPELYRLLVQARDVLVPKVPQEPREPPDELTA